MRRRRVVVDADAAAAAPGGPENGGQKVTITGTGFDPWSGTTVFYFGDQAATNVSCATSTQCTATTPAGWGAESVFADVNHGQSSGTPTYLFGPGAPSCTASYACQHNGSGATTISCGSVQNMTLWKWNGAPNVNSFEQDTNATIDIDEWVDPTSPATLGTPITFMVTLTTSLGTSDSNEMTVDSINCACTTRAVCELANGTQITRSRTRRPTGAPSAAGTTRTSTSVREVGVEVGVEDEVEASAIVHDRGSP
jgi:hypothetical protein